MPARYLHPEFGYLCPTPRLRGFLRGALVASALAVVGGVLALRAGHEPIAVSALSAMSIGPSQSGTKSTPRAEAVKAADSPAGGQAGIIRTDRLTFHVRPPVATADSAKPVPSQVTPAKPACEDNTWAYLDGKCAAVKPRWVRVRVLADNPRAAAAPAASAGKGKASSSGPAAEAAKSAASANSRQSAETSRTAANKKAQTAARNQNRRPREANEKYAGRDERPSFFNAYAAYAPEYGRGSGYPVREGAQGWGRAW